MANINDIESLFSLIGQSPNSYKEFYHEKNGLHALDKWSYLKNIQLENPSDEGISIFENGPFSAFNKIPETPPIGTQVEKSLILAPTPVKKASDISPPDVVISTPRVDRNLSPVIESNVSQALPQSSTFPEIASNLNNPEQLQEEEAVDEPIIPQVYNPASAQQAAPQTPRVYSTSSIPSVPTFSTKFNSPVSPSTATTFTSGFIKPTAPANTNLQSTFNLPRSESSTISKNEEVTEAKSNAQTASPLNSIFSRLEQK